MKRWPASIGRTRIPLGPAHAVVGRVPRSRRHRRPGASLRPGETAGAHHLRALRTDAESSHGHRRPHHHGNPVGRESGEAGRVVGGSRTARVSDPQHGRLSVAGRHRAAHFDAAAGCLRGGLDAIGRAGNSWRGVLRRRPADARVRPSHGAWIHLRPTRGSGYPKRPQDCADRSRGWNGLAPSRSRPHCEPCSLA